MPARQTNGAFAYGKTVWSWHPWLVSSRRRFAKLNRAMRAANSPATEARGIRLRGELGISRQTIAQGRPDAPADTRMLVCVFLALIAHETAGASQHPAFPAPSYFLGAELKAHSGVSRRENASPCLSVVPANAGTHNHRKQYFVRWSLLVSQQQRPQRMLGWTAPDGIDVPE
jgi:hypothetical protein